METSTDHIEDYINNKVSAEERLNFDEQLKTDTAFAKEVEEHIMLLNSFDERQAQELLASFRAIEEELSYKKHKQMVIYGYLKWAAAITLLAVVSIVVYQRNSHSSNELFLAYYTIYPNVESPISRGVVEGDAVWLSYEKGDYEQAYNQFGKKLAVNEADMVSRFYLGISALETNKIKEAENAFAIVVDNPKSKYAEQAQWYLSLTYLKSNKKAKAIKSLKAISLENSSYSDRAKSLIAELE